MTMGTASTMTSATEALGLTLPGASSIPAADSRHAQMATHTGRRIVEMVWEDLKPRDILTPASFDNAITTVLALGGSTNAIMHLIAMARRAGVPLDLAASTSSRARRPCIANIRPAGKYLMEDFYYAGGLRALACSRLGDLHRRQPMHRQRQDAGREHRRRRDLQRRRDPPAQQTARSRADGLAVLRGNLAPDGAVIKPAAMEAHLRSTRGPAVVFRDYNDMAARIDDPELRRHRPTA